MVLSKVGTVVSISDLRKRHIFVVFEKLYQMVRTRKTIRCNITDKNAWEGEIVFEILIAEAKFLSFLKIC